MEDQEQQGHPNRTDHWQYQKNIGHEVAKAWQDGGEGKCGGRSKECWCREEG
jgi:hypothetical protein